MHIMHPYISNKYTYNSAWHEDINIDAQTWTSVIVYGLYPRNSSAPQPSSW